MAQTDIDSMQLTEGKMVATKQLGRALILATVVAFATLMTMAPRTARANEANEVKALVFNCTREGRDLRCKTPLCKETVIANGVDLLDCPGMGSIDVPPFYCTDPGNISLRLISSFTDPNGTEGWGGYSAVNTSCAAPAITGGYFTVQQKSPDLITLTLTALHPIPGHCK
jgi:hypothetical protein